jgi:hypothetical protein
MRQVFALKPFPKRYKIHFREFYTAQTAFEPKIRGRRIIGIFYPANCQSMPNNRGFYGFFNEKSYKNLQAQQAARLQSSSWWRRVCR